MLTTINRAEGNLIHTLDGKNPSQLLLAAIKSSQINGEDAKEDSFYLGVIEEGKVCPCPAPWFHEIFVIYTFF
jgi:hypothetical protein